MLNYSHALASVINVSDDIEIIKRNLQTIDIALRCNQKLLLTDTEQFKIQLDMSRDDLNECYQKLQFFLKGINGGYNSKLLELKDLADNLSRQLDIFTHIYTLKTKIK